MNSLAPILIKKKDIYTQLIAFLSFMIYAISLNYVHRTYLYERQEMWGYSFFPLGYKEYSFILFSIFITSLVTPIKINTPSGMIIYTLYIIVVIPSIVITLSLQQNAFDKYYFILISLVIGYLIISLASLLTSCISNNNYNQVYPGIKAEYFFIFLWVFMFFSLWYLFRDVISFASLDSVYLQREAGRNRNLFEGYMQTYLPNVVCSALMAFGLLKKKWLYIIFAISGYLLMYGITAERTVFLMPFILYALYRYMNTKRNQKNLLIAFNLFISVIFILVGYIPNGAVREFIGFYIVTRIFSIPGVMLSLYHDVFSETAYTFWSHIRGLSFIIPTPSIFLDNKDWPSLGYIVANYRLGVDSNSNANLFATDGVAAAGGLGIIVISLVLMFYLIILDYLSRNVDPKFKVIVIFPVGLTLTNGSLATILLSFGGLFWLLFYYSINTKKRV